MNASSNTPSAITATVANGDQLAGGESPSGQRGGAVPGVAV